VEWERLVPNSTLLFLSLNISLCFLLVLCELARLSGWIGCCLYSTIHLTYCLDIAAYLSTFLDTDRPRVKGALVRHFLKGIAKWHVWVAARTEEGLLIHSCALFFSQGNSKVALHLWLDTVFLDYSCYLKNIFFNIKIIFFIF
jgi:hypothetical protein